MPSLQTVLDALEARVPLNLAGPWDNVGLLLQGDRCIERIMVCIDLDHQVLTEVIEQDIDFVIAYHPTWFGKLRRLTDEQPHGRTLRTLLRSGIHLYSPHTALDAVQQGIADWLLTPFPDTFDIRPIQPNIHSPTEGAGRMASFQPSIANDLLDPIKKHLDLRYLRVAGPLDRTVSSVAVCPGAGTSVFKELGAVDLLLTGEMSHHDVLSWVARGTVVVLTEHSNTERGYLPVYADNLAKILPVSTQVATLDADPLTIR